MLFAAFKNIVSPTGKTLRLTPASMQKITELEGMVDGCIAPSHYRRHGRSSLGRCGRHSRTRVRPTAETGFIRSKDPENSGSRRRLKVAKKGARLDKRLWTELATLTGAQGNSTSLVGTPDQVAEAMLDYYDLGITTFPIRGFDPLEDTVAYGREIIPRVKALVSERTQRRVIAAECMFISVQNDADHVISALVQNFAARAF